jgi:peptidoglycan/xylan/chitin deacetylase (PgdA/CDA1 family)
MAGARLKSMLKKGMKQTARLAGPILPRAGETRILTWHSIGRRGHEMNVSPENFRLQVEMLAVIGPVIPLEDAAEGKPGIALTFDDGYRDNLLHAAPILADHGFPATVFMVAGAMGGILPHDAGAEAARLMTASELRELSAMGFEIGSHTMTHRRLSALALAEQEEEITRSRRLLEDTLGKAVTAFAYPFGSALDYTAETRALVKKAGYRLAVSNRYGVNAADADPWTLRRIWIDRSDTPSSYRDKVTGSLDALALFDSVPAIRLRRAVNRILDPG